MKDREEIVSAFRQCGLPGACLKCQYGAEREGCYAALKHDVLELLKEQSAIIDALLKVGYPHNFQREEPWIVNYMYSITDVVRKAVHLRNEEVKQDGRIE